MKRTTLRSGSAFISACLAPLPEGVEPAASAHFLASLDRDACERWADGKAVVELAKAEREAADWRRIIAARTFGRDSLREMNASGFARRALQNLEIAIRRQMQIPAPTVGALRWKEAHRAIGGYEAADVWIERDRQTHAAELARLAKRRPRRRGGAS